MTCIHISRVIRFRLPFRIDLQLAHMPDITDGLRKEIHSVLLMIAFPLYWLAVTHDDSFQESLQEVQTIRFQ